VGKYLFSGVAASLDIGSFTPGKCSNCNEMAGKVSAYHSDTGYIVTIVIEDWGHVGAYGLLYSDAPLKFSDPNVRNAADGAATLPFVRSQLDDHWWIAYNDTF